MAAGVDGIYFHVERNDFPRIAATLAPAADRMVRKAALDIEAAAKSMAAVDTGTMKTSTQASAVEQGWWKIVVGAEYGIYVEMGTRYNAAQPFLLPAFRSVAPSLQRGLAALIRGTAR